MSIAINQELIASPEDLFNKCLLGDARNYSTVLKEKRFTFAEIPINRTTIGTIDATSCLGVTYRVSGQGVYVQHHDGRALDSVFEMFKKDGVNHLPMQVTLVGGCCQGHAKYYNRLEKHTKENFEKLMSFWQENRLNVEVQGWALGDAHKYETLCSDFIVDHEKIYLMNQGEVGRLNLSTGGQIIPEAARRLATALLNASQYFLVYDQAKQCLELPALTQSAQMREFAQQIQSINDAAILKYLSTTPQLEPPYFPQLLRNMAQFVLAQTQSMDALSKTLPKNKPVFALQGEVVKLVA